MIAQLAGKVAGKNNRSIILEVHDVGYRVFLSADSLQKIKLSQTIRLHTYLAVREDALDLFGFETTEELDYFTLLLTVPGIGPKSALAILSLASPEVLRRAILAEDTNYLTRVSGIGQKSAAKIVLALKDKIGPLADSADSADGGIKLAAEADALEALKSLGYSTAEAREALRKSGAGGGPAVDGKIKAALKILGGR